MNWSPEQISWWLKRRFSDNPRIQLSHETIYKSLFIHARGVLKKELLRHLRSRRLMRRSKLAATHDTSRGQIADAVTIRERPAEVEDRAVPGHWEGDLLSGSNNTHIATLVERRSRYTMLVRLNGKTTTEVGGALADKIQRLPKELRKSLTWDRGPEMAHHKKFTIDTDVAVYSCDLGSPWQRGTNENTNRLLRQYSPRQTDLSGYSQKDLTKVARQLNERPCKNIGFLYAC